MGHVVPCLGASGWTSALHEKADLQMSHFFESDSRQTHLYPGRVANLHYYLEKYSNDIERMAQQLKMGLEAYLMRYYELVDLTVETDLGKNPDDGAITITIRCTVVEDGKRYSFGKLLTTTNSKILKIIDLSNNGAPDGAV